MLKNRSIKLSLVKDPTLDDEIVKPSITRKDVEHFAKLAVAGIGSLMVLRSTLNIIEDKVID